MDVAFGVGGKDALANNARIHCFLSSPPTAMLFTNFIVNVSNLAEHRCKREDKVTTQFGLQ